MTLGKPTTLEEELPRLQEVLLQTKTTLDKHVEDLKAEILLIRTRTQRMDVVLCNKTQMEMYTGLHRKAFHLLLH